MGSAGGMVGGEGKGGGGDGGADADDAAQERGLGSEAGNVVAVAGDDGGGAGDDQEGALCWTERVGLSRTGIGGPPGRGRRLWDSESAGKERLERGGMSEAAGGAEGGDCAAPQARADSAQHTGAGGARPAGGAKSGRRRRGNAVVELLRAARDGGEAGLGVIRRLRWAVGARDMRGWTALHYGVLFRRACWNVNRTLLGFFSSAPRQYSRS